ncbi:MAG: hypothetical protein IM536_02940 [Pseudanabaena sp. M34BS1SP1A06MG]|nr:hypothetical protein [Pseudanabaena sp. M34BS1SP1A06MG]
MSNQKNQTKHFRSMTYREVQRANSKNRTELSKSDQQWLKQAGYQNVGWEKVIILFQKIEELSQERDDLDSLSLEDLFLEADRIGDKYLESAEIAENRQKLALANNIINDQIDKFFPDTEDETIDFSAKSKAKHRSKNNGKNY